MNRLAYLGVYFLLIWAAHEWDITDWRFWLGAFSFWFAAMWEMMFKADKGGRK